VEVKEFYSLEDNKYWLSQIKKSDWGAGQYLYDLLRKNELKELCGETTKVFLLTDDQQLLSFCTLAEEDDVRDTGLNPWIGFVYTFPHYRGHRYMKILLEFAYATAKSYGARQIYISTGETGLYEKYGYSFYQRMKDMNGEDSRVYKVDVK
jgi:GNAT superfamily N-acetyltransferase